jgi:hypothetical protein
MMKSLTPERLGFVKKTLSLVLIQLVISFGLVLIRIALNSHVRQEVLNLAHTELLAFHYYTPHIARVHDHGYVHQESAIQLHLLLRIRKSITRQRHLQYSS